MGTLLRFFLELTRIIVLLVIIESVALTIVDGSGIADAVSQFVSTVVLILFAVWYRRYGQFSGWYKSKPMSH